MKKKLFSLLLTATMAVGALAGCGQATSGGKSTSSSSSSSSSASSSASKGGSGKSVTIGFSQVGAESDWRTASTKSMKGTLSSKNGYTMIFDDAQQKQENQIKALRNFIQQDVDYIALDPVTESGWDTVLKEAKDAGIPVIIVDRMVKVSDDSLYTAWVGSDFKAEGNKACEWLKQYADKKGIKQSDINIVDIQGTIGASAQIGRTEGLNDAVKANGWNLVAQQTGEFTQAKGQEVMESILKSGKKINVVYCENDNEAFGAIDALEAAGKKVGSDIKNGEIMVMSFDSTNAGLTDVKNGKIALDTECNPLYGPRVDEMIKKLEAGQKVPHLQYIDEAMFAKDNTIPTVTAKNAKGEDTKYDVTVVTDDVIKGRSY
ncbi:MAG: LacI family transcriptional regulator [Lachnospiraceae bacterium]|uniref:ABC transporter substrate-binding protein n=1 Tax=Candidatus Weimeria bifida TaxID=2599074 RepID=A0A6N7J337_9FIRM|nr:ABC transporter substrate-binding protein [Candidatus Weimeria bifida]RRF96170.1 MAG: LacI family transcriptional regulator [Lachnospiraceae bacterium]